MYYNYSFIHIPTVMLISNCTCIIEFTDNTPLSHFSVCNHQQWGQNTKYCYVLGHSYRAEVVFIGCRDPIQSYGGH